MSSFVKKIHWDRQKLLSQNMTPKHIYVGREQYSTLRKSTEFQQAQFGLPDSANPTFLGFSVYVVGALDHYVMTGE